MPEMLYCDVCHNTMNETQFYRSNNKEKYPPDGRLTKCKKCITLHVDNYDPETYLWILQEVDVPYIPEEWNRLMMTYARDGKKLTGTTILGRYLAKMQLKQFKEFRWKDNEFLQNMRQTAVKNAMKQQGKSAAEIEQEIQETSFQMPEGPLEIPDLQRPTPQVETAPEAAPAVIDLYADIPEEEDIIELSEEEKKYLITKWGRNYKINELVSLEQLYAEMFNSYDIQAAGDLNTLKLACKTSLKANQLLDIGDIDGAQKMTKMYDGLMKSGKWTASSNKDKDEEEIDSVGELVALCEKQGFIPRYYVDSPKDYVDRVLEDLQHYTTNLIKNESGLSSLIESAIKSMEEEKQKIEAAANAEEEDLAAKMFTYDDVTAVEDKDFVDFKAFEDELALADEIALGEEDDD